MNEACSSSDGKKFYFILILTNIYGLGLIEDKMKIFKSVLVFTIILFNTK